MPKLDELRRLLSQHRMTYVHRCENLSATVTDLIAQLAIVYGERLVCIACESLYQLRDIKPQHLDNAHILDVALMWAVLSEAIEDPLKAEDCIGKAVSATWQQLGCNLELTAVLSAARSIMAIHVAKGGGWFADHVAMCIKGIYGIEIPKGPLSNAERAGLEALHIEIAPRVWPLVADTLSLVGYPTPRDRFELSAVSAEQSNALRASKSIKAPCFFTISNPVRIQ